MSRVVAWSGTFHWLRTSFKIGDAVSVIPGFDLNDYAFYGELANAPASLVAHHPTSLNWVEAAAIRMQYLTAYGALIDIAGLKAGDTVVIPAASSSVGLAAIPIANKVGATPIALTRGQSKRQALVEAGAARVIATDDQDLVKEILAITGGKGARVVFDPVGGPTIEKLTKAMANFGIFFIYGALSTGPAPFPLFDVLVKDLTMRGYNTSGMKSRPTRLGWSEGRRSSTKGSPKEASSRFIAKRFPLEEIVEAHRSMESNQQAGKIVVTV